MISRRGENINQYSWVLALAPIIAKVGVGGSNPLARSKFLRIKSSTIKKAGHSDPAFIFSGYHEGTARQEIGAIENLPRR
jgi:hypothetical protein